MIVGNRVKKVNKTKFRKNNDQNDYIMVSGYKQKHHDRSFYRLVKEEDHEYTSAEYPKTNKRD